MRTYMPNLEWKWDLPTRTLEPVHGDASKPLDAMPGICGLTRHALKKAGIETVGDLTAAYAEKRLAALSGIGATRFEETAKAIKAHDARRAPPEMVPDISMADVLSDVATAASAVSIACPRGFLGGQVRQVDRPDGIRIVMRWRVPLSPRLVAGKLRKGIPGTVPDPRFHFLESRYINSGFQGDSGERKK